MYRYIPFQEIEKNKYNGTVHYATNGNVFGYYWYLKAVYKEFGAIVEEDYQSVLPILPLVSTDDYIHTPELGPYSVNTLNSDRVDAMMNLMMEHTESVYYPINTSAKGTLVNGLALEKKGCQVLSLIDSYESIKDSYRPGVNDMLDQLGTEKVTFVSSVKPEMIVAASNLPMSQQNILLRVMYNAVHRGLGWSQGIVDKTTGKYLALSFYVVSHNVIHEIFTLENASKEFRTLLYDIALRSSAGKPSEMKTYHRDSLTMDLGFEEQYTYMMQLREVPKSRWWQKLF